MDERDERRPLPPVRCTECANGIARLRRCRLAPLTAWPVEKRMGCLYYRERGRSDGKGQ